MTRGATSEQMKGAVEALRARVQGPPPEVALVLGSGLSGVADRLEGLDLVPYAEIPSFPVATVEGHPGRLAFGQKAGRRVVVMQGRVHAYEGYSAQDVVFPVRVMLALGPKLLVLTNAAGGIHPSLSPGALMLIADHLNLTGTSALLGPNDPAIGPRFPDMTHAYDADLRSLARAVARENGILHQEGVYAGVLGPTYETPAEIRMLRTLGADAVGMSTVHEVIAAVHMGARVLGISCITNLAAGLGQGPLLHEEVERTAKAVQEDLERLLTGILERAR